LELLANSLKYFRSDPAEACPRGRHRGDRKFVCSEQRDESEDCISLAHRDRSFVREKAFGARERRSDGPDSREAFSLDGLDIDALHKIQRTETTATARPSACRQDVIAAARVIADGLRAPFP
jgi:hypothetical protein